MSSFLKINFWDKRVIDLKRLDPMRPMDLGDGPELLRLEVTDPRDASETVQDPLFGTRTVYTGYLHDGSAPLPVFIKWGRSKQRLENFKLEGDFYCSALRKLQGVLVPNFYGYYAATDPRMQGLSCMILEQMDGGETSSGGIDNRSRLEAAYRLHKAGVHYWGCIEPENFVTHRGKVYMVSFFYAEARCGCEMTRDRVRLCPELLRVEQRFGNGETNNVLDEIGVPPGWRENLVEAAGIPKGPYKPLHVIEARSNWR